MSDNPDKYDYNRFGIRAKRVGQAAYDILSQENKPVVTAEDIAEARQEKYLNDLKEAAELGKKEFQSPFYVVYLFNKEHWSSIVTRGRFIRRQTEPIPENMMTMFPYYTKDVWKVDYEKSSIDYLWTLPSIETFRELTKNKNSYDKAINEWLKDPCGEKKPYSDAKEV